MGSWGYQLTQSDDAYDFLDSIEDIFSVNLYDAIRNEYIDKGKLLKEFTENKDRIEDIVSGSYSYGPAALLYIAFLRYLEIELNEDQLEIFKVGSAVEMDRLEDWDQPSKRRKAIERLEDSIKNNTPYDFNHKGLFERIEEED